MEECVKHDLIFVNIITTFNFTQEKQMKESEMKEKAAIINVQTWTWLMKVDAAIAEREECAVGKVLEEMGVTVHLVEMVTMHVFHLQELVISYSPFTYCLIHV